MISVVYSTRKENKEIKKEIGDTIGIKDYQVLEYINDGEYSLTEVYNKGLKDAENDIIVFCHDDIYFDKKNWGRKLLTNFSNNPEFGIIGIAGTTDMDESGRWWADMKKMVGVVNHTHNGKKWTNKYSGTFLDKIIETVIVDGLFFAIDKNKIKTGFNEDFNGFHFYDIDFTYNNHLKGVKVGVCFNIRITHKSIGQTNEEWDKNREQFAETYKDSLPKKIQPEFIYEDKAFKFKKQPKIRVIIMGGYNIESVKTNISTIKSFGYENIVFSVIVNEDDLKEYNDDTSFDGLVFKTPYHTINKSLFLLKRNGVLFSDDDELILFLDGDVIIKNNILSGFIKTYIKNKNSFGVIFPRVVDEKGEIISNGVDVIIQSKDNKAFFNFKGSGSYYSFNNIVVEEPLGNLGVCFMTTYKNLKLFDFFKINFNKMFFETYYSLTCSRNRKSVFVDQDSVVSLDGRFMDDKVNIFDDFKSFLETANTDKLNYKYFKYIKND